MSINKKKMVKNCKTICKLIFSQKGEVTEKNTKTKFMLFNEIHY